ncbi:MAG TPA: aminotransferase class IV [Polyangia bacterium]|nr:aminotransferase class IV [Polyangia bacterium]
MSSGAATTGRSLVWIDGAICDAADARVSVFDRGFLYGDSVYEVTRAHHGVAFALDEHLERLERSAAGILLVPPARAEVQAAVEDTIKASGLDDAYVRVVVTRGEGEISLDPALAGAPRLVVIVRPPHPPAPEAYRDGVGVAIVGRTRFAAGAPTSSVDPQVKSGNYLGSVLAVAEARRRNAYEAILCDNVGRLTEGSSSNFFIVKGGWVTTPPLSLGLLEGITRRKVMQLLDAEKIPWAEQALWPIDLHRGDEAFLTSSVRGVVPIARADGEPIGDGKPGPITRRVMQAYDALVRAATTKPK